MGVIDQSKCPVKTGSIYPEPYASQMAGRSSLRLGDAAGLTQFGVNICRLPPGAWSSQRHWHTDEDEFIYVLEGEATLVTDSGEEILRAGDCAGFRAGDPDGHHFQNRSDADVVLLEVGTRMPEGGKAYYPGIDLVADNEGYARTDGRRYPAEQRKT
jgi:uncharacterized cupin superfamily protein